MTIGFNQLPSTIRVPLFYAEFDNSRAVQGLVEQPFRLLVMGQRLTSGTKAALTRQLVTSAEQGAEYFGAGSILADMLASIFAAKPTCEVWAIGLADNGAGVAATGQISFTGTPTKAGTASFMIGGKNFQVGVATTDTPITVAAALVAAINANSMSTVSAAVNGTDAFKVDLTAKNKGLTGNEIDIRHSYFLGEELPTGLAATITAMASGAGNPDISGVYAAIGEVQYLLFVSPFTDASSLLSMETELKSRFGPIRQNDGYALYAKRDSHANLVTLGNTRNSQFTNIMGMKGPSSPWQWASAEAAAIAISVIADDAVRPFHTLQLVGIYAPSISEQFTLTERDILLHNGIATYDVDAGGNVVIEGTVTTYKVNAFNSPDISYLYLNTPMALSYLRFSAKARITQKYGRHKLANDGTRFSPGQKVATPNIIKAELINLFTEWEEKALVEGFDQFKKDLIVERNKSNPNRLDVLLPPDLVNQLVIFGMNIQFLL